MANPDSVGQNTQDYFSNFLLGKVRATALNTSGNAVITIPLLNGGLTNGPSVAASGAGNPVNVTFNVTPGGTITLLPIDAEVSLV